MSWETQNCSFTSWGSGLVPNTWFLGPIRVHNRNDISIGSSVFARLTVVFNRQTNTQTDNTTTAARGRIFALRASNVAQ